MTEPSGTPIGTEDPATEEPGTAIGTEDPGAPVGSEDPGTPIGGEAPGEEIDEPPTLRQAAAAPVGLIIPPLGWRRTAQWAAALKAWWAKHGTNIIEAAKDAASMMQPLLLPPPTESTEPPPSTTPPNTIPAPTTPPP